MKIQQLKYFIEVCKCGTVTKAASNLFVSQPSITSAIKELEQDLGVNLFRRINKKLHITLEGEYFLSKALVIVQNVDELKNEIRLMSASNTSISLGIPAQTGYFLLPIIFSEFCKSNPDVNINIVEQGSSDLMELLEKEQIDIMIAAHIDRIDTSFTYTKLFDSEFCFVTHCKNPNSNKKSIGVNDIENEDLVLLNKSYTVTKSVLEMFAKEKKEPKLLTTTTRLHTVKSLLETGVASSFLLKEAVLYDEYCNAIPLNPPTPVTVSMITKNDKFISPSLNKFMKFMNHKFN